MSNAAKFTQNGQITLSVRRERQQGDDWVSIAVTDTGVGISQEQQANLFSNFAQANPTIAARYGGTGLGLSLSQKLCQLMGGSISLKSERGQGSCFTIRIPAGLTVEAPARDEEAVRVATSDSHGRKQGYAGLSVPVSGLGRQEKILLVDDDHNFLELAERLLLKEGYSPVATDAPESVLQIARTVKPAAIFIDILMPGANGWEVLSALRSDPVTARIPVVMLSVLDDQKTARENGAAALITKPIDSNKLKDALRFIRMGEPDAQVADKLAAAG